MADNLKANAREKLRQALENIALELTGDAANAARFSYVKGRVRFNEDGTRFFYRIKEDPLARVLVFVTSNQSPNTIINTVWAGQSATLAYEYSYLGQTFKQETAGELTAEDFFRRTQAFR